MTTDGGGNPRFKGPGMLWKTPWKGKHPYTGMPFFDHFFTQNAPHYQSAVGAGLPGSPAGFWSATVIFIRPQTFMPGADVPASFGDPMNPTAGGWVLSVTPSSPTLSLVGFSVSDGISFTTVTVPVSRFATPDQVTPAIVIPVVGILDAGTSKITVYADKPINKLSFPFAGPYVSPPGGVTTLGSDFTATTGSQHIGINGLVGGVGVPTDPQVRAWFQAVEDNLKTSSITGITDRLWAANDFIAGNEQEIPAPTKINDEIANVVLTLLAPPNLVEIIRYPVVFDY